MLEIALPVHISVLQTCSLIFSCRRIYALLSSAVSYCFPYVLVSLPLIVTGFWFIHGLGLHCQNPVLLHRAIPWSCFLSCCTCFAPVTEYLVLFVCFSVSRPEVIPKDPSSRFQYIRGLLVSSFFWETCLGTPSLLFQAWLVYFKTPCKVFAVVCVGAWSTLF